MISYTKAAKIRQGENFNQIIFDKKVFSRYHATMNISNPEAISVLDAAEMCGCTTVAVRQWIKKNKVKAWIVAGAWAIDKDSAEKMIVPKSARNPRKPKLIAYDKEYREKNRDKKKEYYREWYKINGRKRSAKEIENIYEYNKNNKEKTRAQQKLRRSLRALGIKRPGKCSVCNEETKLVAHHENYDKPYEIYWLCYSCHQRRHNGAIELDKSLLENYELERKTSVKKEIKTFAKENWNEFEKLKEKCNILILASEFNYFGGKTRIANLLNVNVQFLSNALHGNRVQKSTFDILIKVEKLLSSAI